MVSLPINYFCLTFLTSVWISSLGRSRSTLYSALDPLSRFLQIPAAETELEGTTEPDNLPHQAVGTEIARIRPSGRHSSGSVSWVVRCLSGSENLGAGCKSGSDVDVHKRATDGPTDNSMVLICPVPRQHHQPPSNPSAHMSLNITQA